MMKVFYITMAFPAPSETFACLEVATLREKRIDVSVHALRPQQREYRGMLDQFGLAAMEITWLSTRSYVTGLFACLCRPLLSLELIAFIAWYCWRSPGQLIKSVVLVPQVFSIFLRIER